MNPYTLLIDENKIATIVFDMPGKVNVMNEVFMAAMDEIMDRLESSVTTIRGVILTSAKSTFFAGGDLALMLRAEAGQEAFLTDHFNRLKGYFRRLEKLPVPVVAAINGTALGGGYELCLSCHYRIALMDDRTQIGLPEVQFGILPAAGGVVRLTHLLGLDLALPFLLTGEKVGVQTALAKGLIHDIATSPEQLLQKARDWILRTSWTRQPWDMPSRETQRVAPSLDGEKSVQMIFNDHSCSARHNPAITEIIGIAHRATTMDVDVILAEETLGFVRLVLTENAKRRIGQFFEASQSRQAPAKGSGTVGAPAAL